MLHSLKLVSEPMQSFPPKAGGGLLQALNLRFVPLRHDAEQGLQSDHSDLH